MQAFSFRFAENTGPAPGVDPETSCGLVRLFLLRSYASMAEWFLGVDAGGTHTTALVYERGTTRILRAEAGPGNPWAVGVEAALEAVEHACASVLALAGLHPPQLSAAVLGIAGNGRRGLPAGFAEAFGSWGFPAATLLTSDLVIAACVGLGREAGVHAVVGTGAAVMVQDGAGGRFQLGGWGWFLGDAGSGFDLGWRALRWLVNQSDGVEPHAPLADRLLSALGCTEASELIAAFADPARQRPRLAALAPLVLEAAAAADPVARALLHSGQKELARLLAAALDRFRGSPRPKLSFSGGLAQNPVFMESLLSELRALDPLVEEAKIIVNTPIGALLMAEEIASFPPCLQLASQIESTRA
jgi:glucosamine kinase